MKYPSTDPASMGGPLSEAERAPLSDEELARIRSHAETWRETHDVAPDELMDIDVLLNEAARARAVELVVLGRVGVLEGQLAHFIAQHQPCKNLFRTCVTCRDAYGEPVPWPCAEAKRLGLDGGGTDAE